jgi:hypothetical protein
MNMIPAGLLDSCGYQEVLGFYGRLRDAISAFSHHPAGSWSQLEAGNLKRIFE